MSEHKPVISSFYENLIFEYAIPTNSPVYQMGKMEVRRSRRAFLNSIGSLFGNVKYVSIGNSGIRATLLPGDQQNKWELLLQQGLSEQIEKLFLMYSDTLGTSVIYKEEKLIISMYTCMGRNRNTSCWIPYKAI